MIRSQDEIYDVVEIALEKADRPLTCVELMSIGEVGQAAVARWGGTVQHATEKLSDLLGFMWRRGVVNRFSAQFAKGTKARYSYALPGRFDDMGKVITPKPKSDMEISETDGEVSIRLDKFTIIIRKN